MNAYSTARAHKRHEFRFIPYLLAMLALMAATSPATAQSADEILEIIIDSQRGGETSSATVTMEVMRPDETRVFQIESVSDGFERSLILVTAPPRDAGQAFLQDGDNLFLFNPRLKRTLRIPPSGRNDSFLGSDISFNDLGGRDFEEDYSAEITAENDSTIELTLIPGELAPTPYGKVVLTADANNNYRPLEYLYFDQRETAVRRILFSDFVQVEDLFFPQHIEVENLLEEGEKTVVTISDLELGVEVDENCFKETALERGCN
ncbi:MAG: outer membrane lipoprotein-sorting protein [Trueperaceae bacterium]|nr:MAG: outer membrane lipoprotein-sorting protein [Trueperaceae bacterium]